jgi:imidazolonepropionase-like amidohydrolase
MIKVLFAAMLTSGAMFGQVKAFTGARLIDGTGKPAVENATLLVRDGRVLAAGASVSVPADAERISLSGKTVMPGIINAHGHVSNPDQLGLYARYGVTTVFSLGGESEALMQQRGTAAAGRARFYAAGPVVTAETAEAARARVTQVAAMKPDLIKIRVDDNLGTSRKMSPAVYEAVIDEAHKQKLPAAVHLFYLSDAKAVLRAGADFIAHSVRDLDVDQEVIDLLKQRDVCVSPTFTREVSTFVYESKPAFFSDPFFLRELKPIEVGRVSATGERYKAGLEVALRNTKKLHDAGVRIAMGTDTGPAGRFQGYFEHLELEYMVQAGLTPMQTIVAATGGAARCWKVNGQIGTLEPGAWADFLVLEKNPLDDIRNTKTLESVWIGGMAVNRP